MIFNSPHLPEGWIDAANWHLRTCNDDKAKALRRILADLRMKKFWRACDEAGLSQKLMLAVLVAGGDQPAESPAQTMNRRRALARKIDALAKAIKDDKDGRSIDVESMLHWLIPHQNRGVSEGEHRSFCERGEFVQRPTLLTSEARVSFLPPPLALALEAVSERLRSDKPTHINDAITHAAWAVTTGLSPGKRLVRTLAANTEHCRDAVGWRMIALAARVVSGEQITEGMARASWNSFLTKESAKNPTKLSRRP
jgi:hypothetical protein